MAQPTTEPSSTLQNSVKFYERIADLQGELKNCDTQQFHLEEQFQRLWTQGETLNSSLSKELSSSGHILGTELGHLTNKSLALSAHPTNLNYGANEEAERRRRARNQAILDKLQELETNSSIFAARSERLRMMRSEYESLVRKYASNRKWGLSGEKSGFIQQNQRSSTAGRAEASSQTGASLISTGMNTDITGPIRLLSLSDSSMPPPQKFLNDGSQLLRKKQEVLMQEMPLTTVTPSNIPDEPGFHYEKPVALQKSPPPVTRRPIFLDISSTTESEFTIPKMKSLQPETTLDDSSSLDTTSLSVKMPNSHGLGSMEKHLPNVNVSVDGSLSETSSIHPWQGNRNRNQPEPYYTSSKNGVLKQRATPTEATRINRDRHEGPDLSRVKKLIISPLDPLGKSRPDEDLSDSTSHSVGDSLMDSLHNKTPESLPKDESELAQITEEGIEDEEDLAEDDELQVSSCGKSYTSYLKSNDEPKVTAAGDELINVRAKKQDQETWDHLSSSNLVRDALKEIEDVGDTEEEEIGQPRYPIIYGKENKLSTKRVIIAPSSSAKEDEFTPGLGDMLKDTNMLQSSLPGFSTSYLVPQPSDIKNGKVTFKAIEKSTTPSAVAQIYDQEPDQRNEEKAVTATGKEVKLKSLNQKLTGSSGEFSKSKLTQDDFSAQNPANSSPTSIPFAFNNTLSETKSYKGKYIGGGQQTSGGSDNKKLRLKFDYDDSGSEHSDIAIQPSDHKSTTGKPFSSVKSNSLVDDDLDEFFAI